MCMNVHTFLMWILDVAQLHQVKLLRDSMATKIAEKVETAKQQKSKVLPFRYQFAAGAVAGISEVSTFRSEPFSVKLY